MKCEMCQRIVSQDDAYRAAHIAAGHGTLCEECAYDVSTRAVHAPMTLRALTNTVRGIESEIAPGSESALWGDYIEDMRKRCGVLPIGDYDGDVEVPRDPREYWLGAYGGALAAYRGVHDPTGN